VVIGEIEQKSSWRTSRWIFSVIGKEGENSGLLVVLAMRECRMRSIEATGKCSLRSSVAVKETWDDPHLETASIWPSGRRLELVYNFHPMSRDDRSASNSCATSRDIAMTN